MNYYPVVFGFGQDVSKYPLTKVPEFAVEIKNLIPENGSLSAIPKTQDAYELNEPVSAFAFSYDSTSGASEVFCFTNSGVFSLRAAATKLYTSTTSTTKWSAVTWRNKVYATRDKQPLVVLRGQSSSLVSTGSFPNLSGRYLAVVHDRLMLGNVRFGGFHYPATAVWSDVYNPENFNVSETTESDSFDLGVSDIEITGLQAHRNQVVIFTFNSIWIASYEGLPTVYGFQPLYSGLGNSHHGAVVSVKDVIYFVGNDCVYKMDSFQVSKVGEPIWDSMEPVLFTGQVHAAVDEKRGLIIWSVGSTSFVYSYLEDRWTTCDFFYGSAIINMPFNVKSVLPISSMNVTYASLSALAYDEGYGAVTVSSPTFISDGTKVKRYGIGTLKTLTCSVTLPFAVFDSVWNEKEVSRVRLVADRVGTPVINIITSYRDSMVSATVSETTALSTQSFDKEQVFNIRNTRNAKLHGFKIEFQNTQANHVPRLVALSAEVIENEPEK